MPPWASAAARLEAVVVLPTPPFWLATQRILPTRRILPTGPERTPGTIRISATLVTIVTSRPQTGETTAVGKVGGPGFT